MELTVQQTYDRLLKARYAQLKRFSDLGLKNREFGFIVTPELVLQFNYVHQLVNSFRSGIPADLCAEDGGITCSNMSVIKSTRLPKVENKEPVEPAKAKSSYESDYLTSRIIDLLERPVFGDSHQNMTVNVRDEFSANIRTLSLLFEERYRLCQEQGDRLSEELITIRQQVVASKKATAEYQLATNTTDPTVQNLQEQITRYEAQLSLARARVQSLREMNETSINRNQREVENLLQRLTQSGERYPKSETLLELLRRLIEGQKKEREELRAAVRIVELVHGRKSKRFVDSIKNFASMRIDTENPSSGPDPNEFQRLVQVESVDRVRKTLSEQDERIQEYINSEINKRSLDVEQRMRAEFRTEYDSRRAESQRHFDESVKSEIQQILGGSTTVPVVPVLPHDSNLNEIKRNLDDVFLPIKTTNPVKVLNLEESPIYLNHDPFPADEPVYSMYKYTEKVLNVAHEMYNFITEQSVGIQNINKTAIEDYIPLEFLPKALVDKLLPKTKQIIDVHNRVVPNNGDEILQRFSETIDYLSSLKTSVDEFFRLIRLAHRVDYNKRFYSPPSLRDLQNEEHELMERYKSMHKEALTETELRDLETIRDEVHKYDAEISILRKSDMANGTADLNLTKESFIERSIMNAAVSLEKSKRNELLISFRRLYNDLAAFAIRFGSDFKRLYREITPKTLPPPELLNHAKNLHRLLDEADKTINFGYSPRPSRDLADIVPSLEYFITEDVRKASEVEDDETRQPMKDQSDVSTNDTSPTPAVSRSTISTTNRRRQNRWVDSTSR